ISVMSAVQRADRPEYRNVDPNIPAVSEENQRTSRLMHRTIRSDQKVRPQQILVQLQRSLQIRRTRLLFSFEDNFQVHAKRNFLRLERVNGGKKGDNRSLIVGCRPRID